MISLQKGTEFYYANRDKKEPIKCIIQSVELGYPPMITARIKGTNQVFRCYDGFGCYTLNQYNEAYIDAQIQEDRIIY